MQRNRNNRNRYGPLRQHLSLLTATDVVLTFGVVEEVIGDRLPWSARTSQHWWENDRTRPQARAWLDAGFQVMHVSLEGREVRFARVL